MFGTNGVKLGSAHGGTVKSTKRTVMKGTMGEPPLIWLLPQEIAEPAMVFQPAGCASLANSTGSQPYQAIDVIHGYDIRGESYKS